MEEAQNRGHRRSFTIAFKLKAIRFMRNNSVNKAANRWRIDHRLLRRWRKAEPQLTAASFRYSRRHVRHSVESNKSGFDREMEEILLRWVRERRASCNIVDSRAIKQKAISIARAADPDSMFCASSGWLHRFLHRNGLVCRRISSTGRDLPKNTAEIINNWFAECEYLLNKNKKEIFNMDETAIYLDSPGYCVFEISDSFLKNEKALSISSSTS